MRTIKNIFGEFGHVISRFLIAFLTCIVVIIVVHLLGGSATLANILGVIAGIIAPRLIDKIKNKKNSSIKKY